MPIKEDGSNLTDVVSLLLDGAYVDSMAETAFLDVIASRRHSYERLWRSSITSWIV